MKRIISMVLALAAMAASAQTQSGITDTRKSQHALMTSAPIGSVKWTGGFWGERFGVFSETSVQSMWQTWQTDEAHGFENFLIASGEKEGVHQGPPFHDGDMYKWLEAVASVYAINHDPELDDLWTSRDERLRGRYCKDGIAEAFAEFAKKEHLSFFVDAPLTK